MHLPKSFTFGEQTLAGLTLMIGISYGRKIGGLLLLLAVLLSIDAFFTGESMGYVVAQTFARVGVLCYLLGTRCGTTPLYFSPWFPTIGSARQYSRYRYDETPAEKESRHSLNLPD